MTPATTRASSFRPILAVADLDAAIEHYRKLGFRVWKYSDGGYAFAARDDVRFDMTVKPGSWYADDARVVVYMDVDDADALYREWSASGAGSTEPPGDMPWGMREGIHVDPDGNVIRYGSPLHPHPHADHDHDRHHDDDRDRHDGHDHPTAHDRHD